MTRGERSSRAGEVHDGGWPFPRVDAPRILVVDDDDELRAAIAQILARDGYEVVQAASGQQAIDTLEVLSLRQWSQRPVDLVLTDLRMSDMSGLHIVDLIRTARWPISAIVMTAFPDKAIEAEAERLQVPLLQKPFRLDMLRRIVLCLLATQAKARVANDVDAKGVGKPTS